MRTDEQGKTTNGPAALAKARRFRPAKREGSWRLMSMRWGLEVSRCSGVTLRIVAHPGAEATAISGGDNEHIEVD